VAQVLTEEEKAKARHHLGYLQVQSAYTFALGIPLNTQTQFMIEGSFNNLLPSGYPKFRELLCRLDRMEEQVYCGAELADIESIDTIKINRQRIREIMQMYCLARSGLANLLGTVPNPWDQREIVMNANGAGLNIPVV
jgi:hypothetical protein